MHILLDIFQQNPIAQSIGLIALLTNAIAFSTTKNKTFLIMMAVSSGIWGLHFYMMGLLPAAGSSFLDIIKNLSALKYPKNKKLMRMFIILYSIIAVLTIQKSQIFSFIPLIASRLSLYLIFYQKDIKLKFGFLCVISLWLCYNIIGKSIGGIISDITLFWAGIYWIIQILYKKNKNLT